MKKVLKHIGIATLCIVVAYMLAWWSLNYTLRYDHRRQPTGAKLAVLRVAHLHHYKTHLGSVYILSGFKKSMSDPGVLPLFYATPLIHGLLFYGVIVGSFLILTKKKRPNNQLEGIATNAAKPQL